MKKFGFNCTIYVAASNNEDAINKFWELMGKAGIGVAMQSDSLPNCFVSEVEKYAKITEQPVNYKLDLETGELTAAKEELDATPS